MNFWIFVFFLKDIHFWFFLIASLELYLDLIWEQVASFSFELTNYFSGSWQFICFSWFLTFDPLTRYKLSDSFFDSDSKTALWVEFIDLFGLLWGLGLRPVEMEESGVRVEVICKIVVITSKKLEALTLPLSVVHKL
jgi:hypothetical protein